MSFIIAIDGPAGTGKGTITNLIAKDLGLVNIDTGATYRCATLAILRNNIKLNEISKIEELLDKINIEFKNENGIQKVFLNNEDVTDIIRQDEVNNMVSPVSAIVEVRLKMVELQRNLAKGKNVIMEGRDIGTYVFPNADVKIYLDASEEERAKRRYKQNIEKGINTSFEEVLKNIKDRDTRDKDDKIKKIGALKIADDAIIIDSTNLTIEQVTLKIKEIIKEKIK